MQGRSALLAFGGAYSNHIRAVAVSGKACGFATIGIIRGEEHLPLNWSLMLAGVYDLVARGRFRRGSTVVALITDPDEDPPGLSLGGPMRREDRARPGWI